MSLLSRVAFSDPPADLKPVWEDSMDRAGEAEFIESPGGGAIARMTFATPEALSPADPADKA